MNAKVVKATTKGQITLPKTWRDKFGTDDFVMLVEKEKLTIKPVKIEEMEEEEIIFDAKRDNDGKPISSSEMIKILKKLQNERD